MLIDDDEHDNFFHQRVIKKSCAADSILIEESAENALEYLKNISNTQNKKPNLIFLDINMPGMDGWEFLAAFDALPSEIKDNIFIVMLTTSNNELDRTKALKYNHVKDFKTKPLTQEIIQEVIAKYLK